MLGPESILPKDQQFDYAIETLQADFSESLLTNYDQHGDIIDSNCELDRDVLRLWMLGAYLTKDLIREGEQVSDILPVIYRSMCFALEVADGISPKDSSKTLPIGYLAQYEKSDVAGVIRQDVSSYLDNRPHIAELITKFMPEIDETCLSDHHVQVAAGLIFMLSERQDTIDYAQSYFADIEPADLIQ